MNLNNHLWLCSTTFRPTLSTNTCLSQLFKSRSLLYPLFPKATRNPSRITTTAKLELPLAVSTPTRLVESSILLIFCSRIAGKCLFKRPIIIFNHIEWFEAKKARNRLKSEESPFGDSPWFRKIPKTTDFCHFYKYDCLWVVLMH